jgi:phosphoribosylformylglycinamidine synthase PurS subunit
MQLSLRFGPPAFRLAVLGSGSSGNSLVLEAGPGFSCREIERRLDLLGIDARRFKGLLLTHEHGDHVRGAPRFARRHRVPVFATAGTLEGLRAKLEGVEVHVIRAGRPLEVGGFAVDPIAIPHDAREPVGFVVEDPEGHRVGVVADVGTGSRMAWGRLRDLDALVLETNHDLEMLHNGPYPWHLKQRIAGANGHLSNREAAEGLGELVSDRLQWVVLYHLSRTNNQPELAAASVRDRLARLGAAARICLTQGGKAIQDVLHKVGFSEVAEVRAGKSFEVELAVEDPAEAERRLDDMCRKILANTVVEDYEIELAPVAEPEETPA